MPAEFVFPKFVEAAYKKQIDVLTDVINIALVDATAHPDNDANENISDITPAAIIASGALSGKTMVGKKFASSNKSFTAVSGNDTHRVYGYHVATGLLAWRATCIVDVNGSDINVICPVGGWFNG